MKQDGSICTSTIRWLLLLILGLAAVYLPGLQHELIFDDQLLQTERFRTLYGEGLDLQQRMLAYGSFFWVEAIFGEGWWKQRLVNLVLHVGVVLAVYNFFRVLLEQINWPDDLVEENDLVASRRAALQLGVTVFALNPVAVYAVAYLVQRSVLGATLFVVLALICSTKALLTGRLIWFIGALGFYGVAMLFKEHALMAPLLVLPLYVFICRPGWRRAVLVALACAVPLGLSALLLLNIYGNIIGVAFDELSASYVQELRALAPDVENRLWLLSILNQLIHFFSYGFQWFFPNVLWMSIDIRPTFYIDPFSWKPVVAAVGYLSVLVGGAVLLLRRSEQGPGQGQGPGPLALIGFCLLIPVVLFATEFATVWIQDPFVLYRSYLWAIAVPGLVAVAFVGFRARTLYVLTLLIALLFGSLALERVYSLRDFLSVWSDAIEKIDEQASSTALGRWRPYLNRGSYYLEKGMTEQAQPDFARAIGLREPQGVAYFNLGVTMQLQGRLSDAMLAFERAQQQGHDDAGLHFHRAEVLRALDRYDDARASYSLALERPQSDELKVHTRFLRAEAAVLARQFDEAIVEFTDLNRQYPDDRRFAQGLGMAHLGNRDTAAAKVLFARILAEEPNAEAFYGRAIANLIDGERELAVSDLERALQIDPKNAAYRSLQQRIAPGS